MLEALLTSGLMNASKKAAYPLQVFVIICFVLATAETGKHSKKESTMGIKRFSL